MHIISISVVIRVAHEADVLPNQLRGLSFCDEILLIYRVSDCLEGESKQTVYINWSEMNSGIWREINLNDGLKMSLQKCLIEMWLQPTAYLPFVLIEMIY